MCLGHGSIGRRGNVSYTEGCFLYAFGLKKKMHPNRSRTSFRYLRIFVSFPISITKLIFFSSAFSHFFCTGDVRLLEIIVRVVPNSFVFFHKYL